LDPVEGQLNVLPVAAEPHREFDHHKNLRTKNLWPYREFFSRLGRAEARCLALIEILSTSPGGSETQTGEVSFVVLI
jgi:hypothetical protein